MADARPVTFGLPLTLEETFAAEGVELLESVIADNAHLESRALFAHVWQVALDRGDLFEFRALIENRFSHDWRYIVFAALARDFRLARPDFHLDVTVVNADEFANLAALLRRAVILTVHTGLDKGITRLIDRHAVPVISISALPEPKGWVDTFDLGGFPDVILSTPDCLIEARRRVRDGASVFCHPDFTMTDRITGQSRVVLGTAIFEFARRLNLPVVFAYPEIGTTHIVDLHLQPVPAPYGVTTGLELAEAFRAFIARFRPHAADWEITNWRALAGPYNGALE